MDWTAKEDEMLLASGKAGGEYLESINTTDLAKLNKDQWLAFLRCVIGRMAEERALVELNDEIPFQMTENLKCFICGSKVIWGGDHDLENGEYNDEYLIESNLTCTGCGAFYLVAHQLRQSDDD